MKVLNLIISQIYIHIYIYILLKEENPSCWRTECGPD